ncbi:MAG TPA: cytochrome c [Vicinamibacteria bacterium]|nr:cytochrome c [Vicinamibacteria bacterium]
MVLAAAALALLTASCRGCASSRPPVHLNRSMFQQPKYRPQAESRFFYDGATMQKPVPGTVARGELREDRALYEGKDASGAEVKVSPVPATPQLLARGAERYRIYCQPCHDPRGDGKGILFQRGNVPTTSLHADKVRNATDGHLFDVVTNGLGLMPAYRWPIPPEDRWAIISRVREMEKERLAQAQPTEPQPTTAPGAAR